MKQLKFGYPLIGAIAAVIGLTACADENPWGNTSKEKGKISISLTTNSGISTAKPIFRSDESRADDSNDLSTYCDVPSPEDFSIKLEKTTTGEVSTWSSLSAFKEHIANNTFDTGTYTLTAYYGEKGKQDFEAPYFEASTTFNVLSDQDNEVNLTAELKNSMVKINYTDGFKNYMKDYHVNIRTEGLGEPITYGTLETRPVFIEPNNATLSVQFTTKAKEITSSLSLEAFAPLAKTLHNITFDISENASAEERTLTVIFDDTLKDEDINIDLTNELLTTPAPVITCDGFENGATLDMSEGDANISRVIMTAIASDTIASAILTIESTNYVPSWSKEIDLCKATDSEKQQIKSAGIDAIGFGFNSPATDFIATLELTEFGKKLPSNGNHKVSLVVTDSKGKTSENASVTFDNQEITLELIGNPSIVYASNKAELTFDYNGLNPMDDIHFYEGETRVMPTSCIEQTGTRAYEKKRYLITLPLSNTVKSNVAIKASHKGTKSLGDFNITVAIPEYKIEAYDAFSKYAYLKVTTPKSPDPSVKAAVINNLVIKGNDNKLNIAKRDVSTGIVTLSGLTPATTYTITSSITGDTWNNNNSFTTEVELPIPNGDFSKWNENKLESRDLRVGGNWVCGAITYHNSSSFSLYTPKNWATINDLTAFSGSKNQNTWYVVPSSWLEDGMGIMRNVGYNHDGPSIEKTGSFFSTTHYCTNTPKDADLNKAAGVLYILSPETGEEGLSFSSRPNGISFDYIYTLKDGKQDEGYVEINLLSSNEEIIDSKIIYLDATNELKNIIIPLKYNPLGKQASKLKIYFKSSKEDVPPISIPTGSQLDEGTSLTDQNVRANTYHSVATGSILKIDNVTAVYGDGTDTPANAPKRNAKTRK